MPDLDQQVHYTSLTSRESEVLGLVATGLSNQQIADVLVITIHTVKEHLKNIFTKLDVNKRTMAVARAREIGLLSDDGVEAETDNFPKGNLPHLIMPLIGRANELIEGTQLLAKSDVRLITIHGPGGVGKTHFALEMAHQQQINFKDGAYFVPVASLASSVFLPSAVARALDYHFSDQSNPVQSLLRYLKDKNLLLIIDNFEHLLDGNSFLSEILSVAKNVKMIVTSREHLNIFGEAIFRLKGIDYPQHRIGEDEMQYGAVQLFLRSAERTHRNFSPSIDDLENIARICQVVEGMPLGILLATSWLDTLSTGDILTEIEDNSQSLDSETLGTIFQYQSLRYVFDRSWQLLDTEHSQILMKLAVFRNDFTRDVAHEISGATLSHLKTFVNKSMLQVNSSTGKYYLHELFRQNAYGRLVATADHELIHQVHFDYFRNYVDHADPAELIPLIDDLRAALQWGLKNHKIDELFSFCEYLYKFWREVGYIQEGLDWLTQVLHITFDITSEQHALLLLHAGGIAFTLGLIDMSRTYLTDAYHLARQLDAEELTFKIALDLSSVATFEGKFEEAKEIVEENLKLSYRHENPLTIMAFLGNLGIIASEQHDHEKAIQHYTEALTIADSIDSLEGLSHIIVNLGVSYLKQGNYESAETYLKQGLSIARERNDLQLQVIVLANLSETHFRQEDYEQAYIIPTRKNKCV